MARIGFKKAKYNQIDTSTSKYKTLTDSKVPVFEKVIDEKFAPEYNNAELYANDALAECDYSFKRGTLSLTIADDDDTLLAGLFGNTISSSEVTSKVSDSAPEFGYGHIIPKLVNGEKAWKVEFFPRVRFTKVTNDNKTRGENVEFSTTTIEGIVLPLASSMNNMDAETWEKHQTFDDFDDAVDYLDELLTPYTTSSSTSGSTTTT